MIQRKLLPGKPGTKKYIDKYGDRLVGVRYKYNSQTGTKQITVELIETEEPWSKQRPPAQNKILYIKIYRTERQLQNLVREAGGRWAPQHNRWRLNYGLIRSLGLEHRIDWNLAPTR